jgi:hypothetical protein
MKKFCLYTLGLFAILFVCQTASVEARGHHHRHGPRVQVNIGASCGGCREGYVVRRYAAPVVYAPVVPYAAPVYPVAYPGYVEEVYTQPVVRPFSLAGLSLTWNFFR